MVHTLPEFPALTEGQLKQIHSKQKHNVVLVRHKIWGKEHPSRQAEPEKTFYLEFLSNKSYSEILYITPSLWLGTDKLAL